MTGMHSDTCRRRIYDAMRVAQDPKMIRAAEGNWEFKNEVARAPVNRIQTGTFGQIDLSLISTHWGKMDDFRERPSLSPRRKSRWKFSAG